MIRAWDQLAQFLHRQPLCVVIAGVAEAVGQTASRPPGAILPERVQRLDDEHIVELEGLPRFVFGQEDFVQLFAGADADGFDLALGRDRFDQIHDLHAWDLRDKNFASLHLLDALDDEAHRLGRA